MAVKPAEEGTFADRVTSVSPFHPDLAVGKEFEGKRVARKATLSILEFEDDISSYVLSEYDPLPDEPYESHNIPSAFGMMIQLELEVRGMERKLTKLLMKQRASGSLNS